MDEARVTKEPWLAVFLSMQLPGAGVVYAGRIAAGALVIIGTVAILAFGIWSIVADAGNVKVGLILLCGYFVVWLAGMIVSFYVARGRNTPAEEAARRNEKDPWLAVFLSVILIPGLGLLYLKRWAAFALVFLVYATLIVAFIFREAILPGLPEFALTLVSVGFRIAVAMVTFNLAPAKRSAPPRYYQRLFNAYVVWQLALYGSLLAVRYYIVEPFSLVSGSMRPTLLVGDRVLVWKRNILPLKRGQIILYPNPTSRVPFAHRAAAFEGEVIKLEDGHVIVNGKALETPPYDTLNFPQLEFRPVESSHRVSAKSVFVIGDHSSTSIDSRVHGDIAERDAIGVVYKLIWPLDRVKLLDPNR